MTELSGEELRRRALRQLDILDSADEAAFDEVADIAARLCRAPIALVSLLDRDRQWFKAKVGIAACETPIEQSVCRIDIDGPEVLLTIADLATDERTRANPLVTGGHNMRFYAGVRFESQAGTPLGRLCVIDTVPRPEGLSEDQRLTMVALGRHVSTLLALRQAARTNAATTQQQAALFDIGEHIRGSRTTAEMTRGTAAIVARVLGVDRAAFGRVDAATEHIDIEPDWTAIDLPSIAGAHRFADFGSIRDELALGEALVIDDIDSDPRTAADPGTLRALGIGALVNMPVLDQGETVAVVIVQTRKARSWRPDELVFLRHVADRLEAGDARLRAERQQDMLNGEISHRLKNMLSMVQAIASQTLRKIAQRGPIETFEKRLMALGTAHDVLTQQSWKRAGLAEVAAAVLASLGQEERVLIAGPPVSLGSRAVMSLSLLLHELGTNACKYGALANEQGRIELEWAIEGEAEDAELLLRWREREGPAISAPLASGFGSKLIRLGLVGTGGVDLRYPSTGLEADLRAKLNHLTQS